MMVTSRENLTFLDSGLELISPDDAHLDAGDDKKKAGGGRGDSVPTGLRGGIYSVTLPDWVTLPAFPPLADDPAGVSCRYTIELVGHRKGLFKKNDRISLELPVAIPLKTPITADELEECNWLTHSVHRPLKYQGADDQDVFVTATVRFFPHFRHETALIGRATLQLSHRPITDPADPIIYSLDLLPSPAAQSLFSDPKISTFLARRIRTTPLEHTKSCKEFDWAGIRLNKGEVGIGDKVHGGGMRYRCSVKPPANQCSVEAEGFGVRVGHSPLLIPSSTLTISKTVCSRLLCLLAFTRQRSHYQAARLRSLHRRHRTSVELRSSRQLESSAIAGILCVGYVGWTRWCG